MKHLLESDVIVYDIYSTPEESMWAISGYFSILPLIELYAMQSTFIFPKTFIGISSILAWTRTTIDPVIYYAMK